MAVNIGTLTAYLTADLGNLTTGLSKAQKAVKTYSTQVEGFLQANAASIKRLGKQFVVAGTAVTAALGGMVKKFSSFDSAMRRATAVSDVTAEQFAKMMQMAEAESIRLNMAATKTAEAFYYLGSAGLSVTEQMQAFTPTATLAKAATMEMGQTAEMLVDTMKGFKIPFTDTAHVTDVLAKAVTSSNMTFGQLGETLSYVSGVARTTNNSLEDTVAMIATMADVGIKGTKAGTTLRRSLLNLAAPTSEIRKLFAQYNIEIYNANGQMKPFLQLVGEIGQKLKGASEEQKNMAFSTMFGARAIAGQLAIFDKGVEQLKEFSDELKNAGGAAQEIADKQMAAFGEQIGRIGREIAALFRDIGEKLGPMLLDLGNKVSAIVTKIREWIDAHPELTRNIVEVTAKLAALTIVVGSLTIAIRSLSAIAAVASISLGKIALVLAGASGLIYLFGKIAIETAAYAEQMKNLKKQVDAVKISMEDLTKAIQENREELEKSEKGKGYIALTEAAEKRIKVLESYIEKAKSLAKKEDLRGLIQIADELGIRWTKTWKFYDDNIMRIYKLSDAIQKVAQEQIAAYQKPTEVLKEKVDKEVAIIKAGEEEKVEVAKQTFEKIGDFEQDRLAALRAIYGEMGKMDREVYDGMIMLLNDQRKEYEKVIKDRALLDRWYNHQKLLLDIELLKSSNRLADGFKAASLQMQLDAKRLGEVMYDITMSMRDSFADAMSDMIWEGKRWQDAMLNFARAVGREITNALAKQAATAIMGGGEGGGLFGGGGGIAGALSTLFGGAKTPIPVGVPGTFPPGEAGVTYTPASVGHEGGRIGITPMPKRSVPKSIFFGAPRLHSGGYLGPDEVPIIGKREEHILTEQQYKDMKRPTIVNNWTVTAMDTQTGMQFIERNIRGISSLMRLQIRMNDPIRKAAIL